MDSDHGLLLQGQGEVSKEPAGLGTWLGSESCPLAIEVRLGTQLGPNSPVVQPLELIAKRVLVRRGEEDHVVRLVPALSDVGISHAEVHGSVERLDSLMAVGQVIANDDVEL